MANPYFVTYQFKDQHLGNGDSLRLKIKIQIDAEGSNETIPAESEDVYITDLGQKEEDYQIEDLLITPSFYKSELSVPSGSDFRKYFYGKSEERFAKANRNAEVSLEIKSEGSTTWKEEFLGNIIIKSLDYNPESTRFVFEAAPDMEILGRTMLYDLDGNPINPFGYPVPTWPYDNDVKLVDLLIDCYKLVNPNLTVSDLNLQHDWLFYAWLWIDDSFIMEEYDWLLSELRIQYASLFFDSGFGIDSVADVLRYIAREFCCFTGMLSKNKPFFKKVMYSQTPFNLSEDSYLDIDERYELNKINYVRVDTKWHIDGTTYGEQAFHAPNAEAFTGLKDTFYNLNNLLAAWIMNNGTRISNIRAGIRQFDPLTDHYVHGARDPNIHYPGTSTIWYNVVGYPDIVPIGQLVADFWYNVRSDINKCRLDKIITHNINVSLLNNVIFGDREYMPLRILKRYKELITEIDGIIV